MGEDAKTMWSSMMLDTLYSALKNNKSDEQVKVVIADLRAKNYNDKYIINMVKRNVDAAASARIQALLAGKKTANKPSAAAKATVHKKVSKAEQARINAARKRKEASLLGRIMGFFSKLLGR